MRSARSILSNEREFYISLGVTLIAAFGGFVIQFILLQMQKRLTIQRERSLSITADRGHYAGDFWYNLLNACGLIALWYFKLGWIDAAFGLAGSAMFLKSSFPIIKHGLSDVLHMEVSGAEQKLIVELVLGTDPQIQGVHRLRSRRLGPTLFVDFHLKLPAEMTLEVAHRIGERVSAAIRRQYPRTDVIIHLDPDSEPDDEIWEPSYHPIV
jgi:ferrous-iron efflux pump FieF